ncbi:MAG TPA: FtsQ-type POTRA domain-containing protein [Thermoanaerobaculia bacterium]|nr:FtsQ-type POTRA domain-containing protein [Thermoanaerobaculia bacterium]
MTGEHGIGGAGGIGTGGGTVVPFRRPQGQPRRKRRSLWVRLMRPLVTALGIVGLPIACGLWVATAPQFALREIAIDGAGRASEAWIRGTLEPLSGRNLPLLPLAEAAERLRRHPWVDSVELSKELPGRLRVRVVEKRPAVFLRRDGRLYWADTAGRAIAPVGAGEKAGRLLVVSFGVPSPRGVERALEVAAELGRANPNWAASLAEIEVLGEEDFRLRTGALPFPVLVRSGDVIPKVHRLEALLPRLAERYPALAAVDLRFSRRIVLQPAAGAAPTHGARS